MLPHRNTERKTCADALFVSLNECRSRLQPPTVPMSRNLLLGLWHAVKEAGGIEIPFNPLRRPPT